MSNIDKILETLKNLADSEEKQQLVNQLAGDLKSIILEERTNAHNIAREQLHNTFKKQLSQFFDPEERPESYSKWEDMLVALSEKIKKPKQEKAEAEKSFEQLKAKLESEFEKRLGEEKRKLVLQNSFNTVEAAAIAKKLDPAYKKVFKNILLDEIEPEFLEDDRIVFKDKKSNKYFISDGEYASPEFVADEILKRYPKLTVATVTTPQPPQNNLMANKIQAGLSELKIFKNL